MKYILHFFSTILAIVIAQKQNCTTEQYRPRYHFSPARNWMNDPNGLVYYNGTYHLFFQHNPESTDWGPMHWGHAISTDMITWKQLDIALYPDDLGTIYSGSAVVDYGNTTGFQTNPDVHPIVAIFTHAGDQQRQSLAYSLDGGYTFTKYEGNPVIENPGIVDFRDPKVIRFEEESSSKWVMVLAAGNHIDFYSSTDLKSWTKTSEFGMEPEQGHHGGTWECPDLVKLPVDMGNGIVEDKWVLIISTWNHPNRGSGTHYLVGSFNGTHFTSSGWDSNQWVDWAWDNYAGQTFSNDPKNRTVFIGWMANGAYQGSVPTGSWRGQLTIPRQLGLRLVTGDGSRGEHFRLTSWPVEELENIREETIWRNDTWYLSPGASYEILPISDINFLIDFEVSLEMIRADTGFTINAFNIHSSGFNLYLNYNRTVWSLNREGSGDTGFNGEFQNMLRAEAPKETNSAIINIRVLVDVSTFEVFADDGLVTMTAQYFPGAPLAGMVLYQSSDAAGSLAVLRSRVSTLKCVREEGE